MTEISGCRKGIESVSFSTFRCQFSLGFECIALAGCSLDIAGDIIKKIQWLDKNTKSAVTRLCIATEEITHATSSFRSNGSGHSHRTRLQRVDLIVRDQQILRSKDLLQCAYERINETTNHSRHRKHHLNRFFSHIFKISSSCCDNAI